MDRQEQQEKFPPHLHYGTYKDNGYMEWAYDPYYQLSFWERQERQALKKKTGKSSWRFILSYSVKK
ncbi:hypothetical protein GCM10020331_028830 [Ectobacillus funiculus]